MRTDRTFRRMAAWLAIFALPLAYANVGLALVAVGFDPSAFRDASVGLRLAAQHPGGAMLTRWSMISDMLGFYLMLVPLALVLWDWLREQRPSFVSLATLLGLAYLLCGAVGAAVLAAVMPAQIEGYLQADAAHLPVYETVSLAFTRAVYDGVWGLLDPILGGLWWLGIGLFLRRQRPALGWTTVALGLFMLLRDVKIGPLEWIGLAVYFVLAPLWAAWVGIDLLRREVGQGEREERER